MPKSMGGAGRFFKIWLKTKEAGTKDVNTCQING